MGYNHGNDEVHDNIVRMRREHEFHELGASVIAAAHIAQFQDIVRCAQDSRLGQLKRKARIITAP
jgi:hypothetical protein